MDVNLILSIVIAGATVFYVVINFLMLCESIKTRKQRIAPLIIVFLKSTEDHRTFALHIKNVGMGVAKNIRINLNQEFYRYSKPEYPLSEVGIFKNGFNIFPPDYELKYHINIIKRLYQEDPKGEINLNVSYDNVNGKRLRHHYSLRFDQMFGQNYSTPPESYAGQTPYYLKEINETLTKIESRI